MTLRLRDTVLVRADDVDVHLASGGVVRVSTGAARAASGPHCLAVLDCFSIPRRIDDALQLLATRAKGLQDLAEMSATIRDLLDVGVLRSDAGAPPRTFVPRTPFDKPGVHTRMLNDRHRTDRYLEAIHEVVRPGDVVVDLGTGSGVLAVAAAKCGARRVYAIEVGAIAEVAEAVVRANGVADIVTVVRGHSADVTLPERASVLISETIGNEPLDERIVQLLYDARRRFCADDARIVPSTLDLYVLPVSLPPDVIGKRLPTPDRIDAWRAAYGMDFSSLTDLCPGEWTESLFNASGHAFDVLGAPRSLGRCELGAPQHFPLVFEASLTVARDGLFNGVAVFFEAQLSPGVRLSVDPRHGRPSSWALPVWLRASPIAVRAGDVVSCRYRSGNGNRLDVEVMDQRRNSDTE